MARKRTNAQIAAAKLAEQVASLRLDDLRYFATELAADHGEVAKFLVSELTPKPSEPPASV